MKQEPLRTQQSWIRESKYEAYRTVQLAAQPFRERDLLCRGVCEDTEVGKVKVSATKDSVQASNETPTKPKHMRRALHNEKHGGPSKIM